MDGASRRDVDGWSRDDDVVAFAFENNEDAATQRDVDGWSRDDVVACSRDLEIEGALPRDVDGRSRVDVDVSSCDELGDVIRC